MRQIFYVERNTHVWSCGWSTKRALASTAFPPDTTPNAQLNPADFGILNGISEPIGLPQISIAGGLNFGGPAINPSGRGDTTFVVADTLSWLVGRHSLKLGGEFRQFLNNIFRQGTGSFNFPDCCRLPRGHRELVQRDARQSVEQHRPGRARLLRARQL